MFFHRQRHGTISVLMAVICFASITTLFLHETSFFPSNSLIHNTINILGEPGQPLSSTISSHVPHIPRKIWQVFHTLPAPVALADTTTWLALNPGYQYEMLGEAIADEYVIKHFSHDKTVVDTYLALQNRGLKTDLFRYLVLWREGGVYADLDTQALKPIDVWIPENLSKQARIVIGLEWDQLDGDPWPGYEGPSDMTSVVQFCQWALVAAPRHELFESMIQESVKRIAGLAAAHNTSVSGLNITGHHEVVTTTGPSAFTDVVFAYLQRAGGLQDLKQLSNMSEPRLVADVLVLTIDGFGMGQPHSRSTQDETSPTVLVRHRFAHTWV